MSDEEYIEKLVFIVGNGFKNFHSTLLLNPANVVNQVVQEIIHVNEEYYKNNTKNEDPPTK